MQGLFGLAPLAVHAQQHDQVVWRRDIEQVAHALHVRLPGEHPEVAHEDRTDRLDHGRRAFLDGHGDRVRAAHRNADELAVDESRAIALLVVREGRGVHPASHEGRVDHLGILDRLVEA